MRFKFSRAKSDALRRNPKRAIGFEEAREIFTHPYYQDRRNDDPEQYRAIGWAKGRLISLIFEIREDHLGGILSLDNPVAGDAAGEEAL